MGTNRKHVILFLAIELAILLLCLYYSQVTPVIFQNRLGTVCYIALCLSLMILAGITFVMAVVKKIPLHRVILFVGFSLGILSCLINTPGSIPDEPKHASNIYLWSNRLLMLEDKGVIIDNPIYIDVNSVSRHEDINNATKYLRTETTIDSYRQILRDTNWFYSKTDSQLVNATLRDHSVTPIMYFPAILGFTIARLLSLGYYPMLILGRLMMLAFYIFAVSWSIKKIPVGKMTLFITALLPMSIHLAASLSYDAVILGLAMMTFAYIIYLAYGDIERVGTKEWLAMLVLSALLAPCKVGVYLPIVLLLFLVPTVKLGSRKKFFWFFMSTVATGIASCLLMNLAALAVGVSKTPFQNSGGDTIYSMQWVFNHPVGTMRMMINTVMTNFLLWLHGSIGFSLSWFSISLPMWIITGFEVCLLLTTMKNDDVPSFTPNPHQRLLLLLPVVLCVFIFLLGMLVWWTPEGYSLIQGVQGRYFIPMIPLIMLAIPQTSITLHLKRGDRRMPWKGFSNVLALACVLLSCASILSQASTILSR